METRLKNLVITNLRSISGTVAVPLDAPVVLLHGSNGVGKTSILSALELCLTGDISHLQRVDRDYERHLLHRGAKEGSVSLTVAGDLFPNQRAEITLEIDEDGASRGKLLDDENAKFFSERCYLPQATLNRLLEIYQNATSDEASPLTKFVKDLLGLDQLDALVDGLYSAFHVQRIRNLVSDFRRFESLRSELKQDAENARTREVETRRSASSRREFLASKLKSIYPADSPMHGLLDKPNVLREAVARDDLSQTELSKLTEARQELAGLTRRWHALPETLASEERRESEAEERDAREAYRKWTQGPGRRLNEVITGLADLFPNLPSSLSSDPESARVATETIVLQEKARCDRILRSAVEANQRVDALDATIQRSRSRLTDLERELPSLSQDAEALASALAAIVPHIHGDECPVCLRDYSELRRGPLAAQVSASIARLTTQAGRLKAMAQSRAEETARLAAAERDRMSAQQNQLAPDDLSNTTLLQARLAQAATKLASLGEEVSRGATLLRRLVAARDSLASAQRRNEVATQITSEVAHWTSEILDQPIDAFNAVGDALGQLVQNVNARIQFLEGRELTRRELLLEAALYADELVMVGRYENARKDSDGKVSSLREIARHINKLRDSAKSVANAARNARTNIVGRVFNTSLNKVWRDLFVRLAPQEQFVPKFKLPPSGDHVEAALETAHKDGGRGGPPGTMLSAGNLNTAALTLFLALHLSVKTRLPWIILDDPVQSMDDVHISQFAALLRMLARTRDRQIILAVHDRALFDYLTLELSPAFEDDCLITIEISQKSRWRFRCDANRSSFQA